MFVFFYALFSIFYLLYLNNFLKENFNFKSLSTRVFTIIETLFFALFFINILPKVSKLIFEILILLFFIFSVYDLKNSNATEFDSISTGLECILFISFSIIYLYERISKVDGFVYDLPEFWVVFGIIIYFSGNFFIFIFAQNSLNQNSFKETFNTINAISSIIENIMFLIAFVIAKRQFKPLKQKKVSRLKPEFQSNS
jgi:hypothetical protein